MKTLQETFDFIVSHLAKQKKAAKQAEKCLYLTDDGHKCAVGCLLSEDVAKRCDTNLDLNGDSAVDSIWHIADKELRIHNMEDENAVTFYRLMQIAHDQAMSAEELRQKLWDIAEDYKLNDSMVVNITEWEG
jgi:hypothetical protein